jgi:hypothetical protein
MLSMVTPAGARAPRTLKDLTDGGNDLAAAMVVQRFEEARLLVREGNRAARDQDKLTLAHEALLTHWGKLRAWVAEDREERLLREDLTQAAAVWAKSGDDELLWRRRRLLLTQEILRKRGIRLEGDEKRFFNASLWASRRGRLGLLALAALAALASIGGAGGYVYVVDLSAQKAVAEAQVKIERALKAEAQAEARVERALKEAAEARAQVVVSAYAQIQDAVLEREKEPPEQTAMAAPKTALVPGIVGQIEEFINEQRRANEPVPELLEDVIPEAALAPQVDLELPDDAVASAPPAPPPPPRAPAPDTSMSSVFAARSLPPGAAYAALRTAQAKAGGCRSDDGPHGAGKLVLVIAPTGRVTSVVLERPFAGKAVGQCIESVFRDVIVPPFEGKPLTLLWSFAVR